MSSSDAQIQLYYSDLYSTAISPEARFPRERYQLVKQALISRDNSDRLSIQSPTPASRDQILLAHQVEYVDAFLGSNLTNKQMRQIGLQPWQPDFVKRTLTILGGSIASLHAAVKLNGFAGNLAGGTHHAFADHGEAYCVFNDLAVCAKIARFEYGLQRIVIIDCDVHQGNGTATMLNDDPDMFTFSIHGEKNFPFRKEQSDLDISLPDGCKDTEYLAALEHALTIIDKFNADIIFYQAGCDPLAEDRLGKLALTRMGLQQRNEKVFSLAKNAGVPVVIFMGGGYAEPIDASVQCHADVFTQAADKLNITS